MRAVGQPLIKTYELKVGLHRMYPLYPASLEAQVTHVEVGGAGSKRLDVLGGRLIVLGAIALR